ncbi:ATP-binding protein [Pontibacter chitinilyticus]|uniref:ATP-binding protein n=1 Tax=Pontibacter chitinilyticus TaxID=2674989 RepID=UPI00321C1D29
MIEKESGLPFIQNFNPKDYLHFTNSFEHTAILQDNKGRMLIGSHGGILVYNGNNWQFIKVPGSSIVWALDKDATGRIYVGASDNLGYIAADENGEMRFVSLLPKLPKDMLPLREVWSASVTPEGVYYKTNQYLMRWQNNRFKVWKAANAFGFMSWINGKLYVQPYQDGLFVLQGDRLQLFSKDKFFWQNNINFIQPLRNNKWLVGINNSSLYMFDGHAVTPVNSPVQAYFKENYLFSSKRLADGNIAFTTLRGGVVITDQEANIQTILKKESGLAGNTAYLLSTDNQGGLWISMEQGISRVQTTSPLTYFNERNGLQRQTYAMATYQGEMYAGTTDGLFVLKARPTRSPSANFSKVPGFNSSVWALQPFNQSLLLASEAGLLEYRQGKFMPIPISAAPWKNYCRDIERSKLDSAVVYVTSAGLYAFRQVGERWQKTQLLPELKEDLSQVIESPDGDLWLPVKSGVLRVRFQQKGTPAASEDYLQHATAGKYDSAKGLPSGAVKLYLVGKQLLAQVGETDSRLYRYNERRDKFEPAPNFAAQFGLAAVMLFPATEYSGTKAIWLWTKENGEQNWQLKRAQQKPDGTYQVQAYPLSGTTTPLRNFAYQQGQEAFWFGGIDGLIRLDEQRSPAQPQPFSTLLERIVLPADSVLYPRADTPLHLSYQYNSPRFEVAAPSYNGAEDNWFQFWLQGYDQGWSAWTKEPFKAYTQIPEGTYNLRARSINAQGQLGKEAIYTFSIQPPWYRTFWMYLLYLIGAASVIYFLLRWRFAALKAEKVQLEHTVTLRTEEIAAKNEQLSYQAEALAAQAEKLQELDQLKSRFFANISHEFRTPLTIILNNLLDRIPSVGQKQEQTAVPVSIADLKVMSRNATRLLQLINQLLDLSKVESGHMVLETAGGDLTALLRLVYTSFSSLAEHKQIEFAKQLPDTPLLCAYDADKVEKVLYNLLSNAFKFTPAHGKVQLKASLLNDALPPMVRIVVEDNGPGLAPDQLEHVFDRFYQGEQHYTDAQGTGIGLALAKELVALYQGQLWVESEPGKGAAFIMQLPYIPVSAIDAPAHAVTATLPSIVAIPEDLPQELVPENAAGSTPKEAPLVLIVEDSSDLCHYIRRSLEGKYRVLESTNGAEGLAKALETIPDLIISDWMMPEMDGITLCSHLKEDVRTSHIPIILLTALATADAKLTGLQTGADEYLTKPFDSRELHSRIQNLIANRRKLREHFSKQLHLEPTKMVVASVDEKFLRQVMQLVDERMGDADFSVDEFSREIGLSRVHLHRKLKALTGQSPSDFVRVMRLQQAAHLLEARAGNVAEIAYQVGFNNLSYFSKCFRAQFGVLPTEYAAQQPAPLA